MAQSNEPPSSPRQKQLKTSCSASSWLAIRGSEALSLFLILAFLSSAALPSAAKPFVWARSSDALTLDPHAVNEGVTHALNHQIYEPLLIRDHTGKTEPALAQSWTQSIDPLVWVFTLRPDVKFHEGEPLTSEDVVFSLNRALATTSDLRSRLSSIKSFKALEPDKIEIVTHAQDPLLPIRLSDIFIMSKSWAEKHDVVAPQNFFDREATYAANNANGTGPYKLVSREPNKETRLTRNEAYWGWQKSELPTRIADLIYRPIADHKERVTALLTGTVDFVQDVPLDDLDVLRQAPAMTLRTGPENRVIFLGLSIKSTHDGQPNPLANPAVREAISIAIDRRAIQLEIMLGQSIPTAVLAPPGINGFPFDLDNIPNRDLAKARQLLAPTLTPDQSSITLDCPTNRYTNDARICKVIAEQLGAIGLKVTTALHDKADHFDRVRSGQSQFYLLGWGVPTFDSAYIFSNLFHTRTATLGSWNGTGYSDPAIDKEIQDLSLLADNGSRNRSIGRIWEATTAARVYIPIHVQTLMYAMHQGITIDVDISNTPKLKYARIAPLPAPASDTQTETETLPEPPTEKPVIQ